MEIEPARHQPKELYKLLIGCVVPRPIAWITTVGPQGEVNLAPFSFFNAVCSSPPTVSVAFSYNPDTADHCKDTLVNLRRAQEFVVNVVAEPYETAMTASSADYPRGVSETEALGLTTVAAKRGNTPRLAAAPIALECVPVREIAVGEGPGSATLVLAEVVHLTVRDELIDERMRIDLDALRPIGRLAGNRYCYVREIFEIERPRYRPGTC